jgi:hypothetical protein
MRIKDRIKELRRIKASDLPPHPKNWRTHPTAQLDALRGVLSEIGWADALLVRETPSGLQLIDGHARTEVAPDAGVPVLVLDVTDEEADKILATHDPLAAMAEVLTPRLFETGSLGGWHCHTARDGRWHGLARVPEKCACGREPSQPPVREHFLNE